MKHEEYYEVFYPSSTFGIGEISGLFDSKTEVAEFIKRNPNLDIQRITHTLKEQWTVDEFFEELNAGLA